VGGFCPADRAVRVVELYGGDADAKAIANRLVESFGVAPAPAFIPVLEGADPKSRALAPLLCQHAVLLAPALALHLPQGSPGASRVIIRALGFAAAGYETPIADQLGRYDEQTDREALRALARIGPAKAAAVLSTHLREGSDIARAAAEEALWHFPPALATAQLREILGRRDFVLP